MRVPAKTQSRPAASRSKARRQRQSATVVRARRVLPKKSGASGAAARRRMHEKMIEGGRQLLREEQARLRALGIIDEHGNLLKRPPSEKGGEFGGWG